MENSKKLFIIKGVFKHYDWGGKTFIPQLLQLSNEEGKRYAEYWLGNKVDDGVARLPYLLKVQDVERMLSIQVHPDREAAVKKFAEENAKGIPPGAANRNFKDDNHKPELLSPVTDFYLLHGFRPAEQVDDILNKIPELNFLKEYFSGHDFRRLYTEVMTMQQAEVNERLRPLTERIVPLYHAGKIPKESPDFWAARAALSFNRDGVCDRGIFSIYLFNIVILKKGEALFQDAGLPHAYLEGHTIEIMANSDNVLRGGLTSKHIDVNELLQHIRFEATYPHIIRNSLDGNSTAEQIFITPARDFQLSRIVIKRGEGLALAAGKTDIYFVFDGRLSATADEQELRLSTGTSMLALTGSVVHFAAETDSVLYRATEPIS